MRIVGMISSGIKFFRSCPDLWKLFWSNVLWTWGAGLYFFVWPNYVRDLGGSPQIIGYLTGLMFGVMALTTVPGGWLADRVERRKAMVLNWGLAAFAPLLYARAKTWPELIPGVILYGLFFGWPVMEAYVADCVPPDALGRAFALVNSGYALGAGISPLLGAVILNSVGMPGLFILSFLAFAASTTILGLIRPQRPSHTARFAPGFQTYRSLWAWVAILVITSAASAGLRPFLAPFLEDRFKMERAFILASGSLLSFGEFFLAWPLGHDSQRHPRRAILTALTLSALGSIVFLWPYGFVPGLFLMGANRVVYSLLRSSIGARAQVGRGRVFASTQVLATAAEALAPMATGWLYFYHPVGPFVLFSTVFASFAVLLFLRPRR